MELKKCKDCFVGKPLVCFYKNANGYVHNECKDCAKKRIGKNANTEARKAYKKKWDEANRGRSNASKKKSIKKRRAEYKSFYSQLKCSIGCWFCGENNSKCLDFHHKDKKSKKDCVAVMIRELASKEAIDAEIKKCIVLCSNCHRKLHAEDRTVVIKGWGHELWIVNSDKYCGKLLGVKRGKKCSFHYHKLKDETFYIKKGEILLRYCGSDDFKSCKEIILTPGDSFHVTIGMRHQFEALVDSEIIEFSTTHYDSDSYRVIPGD